MDSSAQTDKDLAALAADGREEAYGELLKRYERPVFALIFRMVRDRSLAEDLAQEAFIRSFNGISSYDPRYKFSSWIFKIANNHTIDHLQKRKLVQMDINTMAYHKLALSGLGRHLGSNQEADDAQIKSIRYHADTEGTQSARSEDAPVYVIVSRRSTRQDRTARRRGPREQGDRRASRHATSCREQVAQALLPRTPRRARGSFPQRSTLCFFPLAWSRR